MTWRSSALEMWPSWSLSNTLNASRSSSSGSAASASASALRDMSARNSANSMVPLPSASTSRTMSRSSSGVGDWPRERMTVDSSSAVMQPSPSLSKKAKASRNSLICSELIAAPPAPAILLPPSLFFDAGTEVTIE
ncbi:hypothetical protein ACQJBY_042385 [Aegilops geniculata]